MATYIDRRDMLWQRMEPYWNPSDERHFGNLQSVIDRCIKLTLQSKSELEQIDQPNPAIVEPYRRTLAGYVEMVRFVEEKLNDAYRVASEGYTSAKSVNDNFRGDYRSFADRLDRMTSTISDVYRNALYPLLLSIQNAEKGYAPGFPIWKIWDWVVVWKEEKPEAIINKEFPKKVTSSRKR